MNHERLKEDVSAFLDGQLSPHDMERVKLHLAACSECRTELEILGSASTEFRSKAAKRAPAGLAERILAEAKKPPPKHIPLLKLAFGLAVIVGAALIVGKLFKVQIGGVFNTIMGMISSGRMALGSPN